MCQDPQAGDPQGSRDTASAYAVGILIGLHLRFPKGSTTAKYKRLMGIRQDLVMGTYNNDKHEPWLRKLWSERVPDKPFPGDRSG